jgi:hypothetical protein
MQRAHTFRAISLLLAGLLLAAASLATSAQFAASQPGQDLSPVGTADQLISLLQGQQSILWTSTAGAVSHITVTGWPVNDGDVELGGAMSITRPDGGDAGALDIGEKPMSVTFEFEG